MRFTSNGIGLKRRMGASKLGLIVGLSALLTVAAVGCGSAEPNPKIEPIVTTPASAGAAAPTQTNLPGNATWVLDSLDGAPLFEGSTVTLRIDEDQFDGFDGCNSYGGLSEDGTSIADADGVFSRPPLARTEKGCEVLLDQVDPDVIMDQADVYISALRQGERYRIVGDRLEIIDSGGAARLVFVRDAPLPGRPITWWVPRGGYCWRAIWKVTRVRRLWLS